MVMKSLKKNSTKYDSCMDEASRNELLNQKLAEFLRNSLIRTHF